MSLPPSPPEPSTCPSGFPTPSCPNPDCVLHKTLPNTILAQWTCCGCKTTQTRYFSHDDAQEQGVLFDNLTDHGIPCLRELGGARRCNHISYFCCRRPIMARTITCWSCTTTSPLATIPMGSYDAELRTHCSMCGYRYDSSCVLGWGRIGCEVMAEELRWGSGDGNQWGVECTCGIEEGGGCMYGFEEWEVVRERYVEEEYEWFKEDVEMKGGWERGAKRVVGYGRAERAGLCSGHGRRE